VRLLVCGAVEWAERDVMWRRLDWLAPRIVGHGDARGADRLADAWASARGCEARAFPADWRPDGHLDMGAGKKRNVAMLATFRPDLVAAFKDHFDFSLRTGGTEHMVKMALATGVPCQVMTSAGVIDELFPLHQQSFNW
jgi:hypothetical protein